jgi:hypothetical protein
VRNRRAEPVIKSFSLMPASVSRATAPMIAIIGSDAASRNPRRTQSSNGCRSSVPGRCGRRHLRSQSDRLGSSLGTFNVGHRIYRGFRVATFTLAVVVLGACGQDPPKDEYRFIEYVEIEGSCFEDHVRQPGKYTGSIVHWRNVTKNTEMRYGSVHRWAEEVAETSEQIENPHKYFLPFSIQFDDVAPQDLRNPTFTAKGVAKHITGRDGDAAPQYEATCLLAVVKRSATLPPASERR